MGPSGVDPGEAVRRYLDLMDHQREGIFAELEGISQDDLWRRPEEGEWSMGENLDHARLVIKSALALIKPLWIVLKPIARLRRNQPVQVEMENVYARAGFPMGVGWIWTPRYKASHPLPLAELQALVAETHRQARDFYTGKDPWLLAHAPLFDPVIGTLNYVQALRVGIYHDELHFDVVRRQMGQANIGQ